MMVSKYVSQYFSSTYSAKVVMFVLTITRLFQHQKGWLFPRQEIPMTHWHIWETYQTWKQSAWDAYIKPTDHEHIFC